MYHLWNGVRVLVFDFAIGTSRHKSLYYAFMALGVLTLAVFAYFTFDFLLSD